MAQKHSVFILGLARYVAAFSVICCYVNTRLCRRTPRV